MRISHHAASTPPGRRSGGASRRGEAGETLIEVLVTVILMGIGFVAVMSAILTAVNVATVNSDRTTASLNLQSWAEEIEQPFRYNGSTTYIPCATGATYGGPASFPVDANFTATMTDVKYFRDFAGGQPNFTTPLNTCYTTGDKGMQLITIRIESPTHRGSKAVESVTVVKRDRQCPTTYSNADLGPC